MGDRCTGHCCKTLSLPVSPEDLEAKRDIARPGTDWHFWARNAVPLGTYTTIRDGGKEEKQVHVYTCKKFDPEAGQCTDYENRPRTCRAYPERSYCGNNDCTAVTSRPVCNRQEEKPYQRGLSIGVKSNVRVSFSTRHGRFRDERKLPEVGTPAPSD